MPVHRALGRARGARRVEPERPGVLVGCRHRAVLVRALAPQGDEIVPRPRGRSRQSRYDVRTREHEVLHPRGQVDGRGDSLDVLLRREDDPGAGVGDDRAELVSGEHRRHGHRDDTGAERPQDAAQQLDVVGHHEDDAVVPTQPELSQR